MQCNTNTFNESWDESYRIGYVIEQLGHVCYLTQVAHLLFRDLSTLCQSTREPLMLSGLKSERLLQQERFEWRVFAASEHATWKEKVWL